MKKTGRAISFLALFSLLGAGMAPLGVAAKTLRERDEAARAQYQADRQQYLKEVGFYKEARQDFQDARAKFAQLKNAENRKALEEAGRNYLVKAITSLIKKLETIKNWVANREALSETERQSIMAEIDKDITWLNAKLVKVQSASPQVMKEEAKTVRAYWKVYRARVKMITGLILAARINFVIAKAEKFAAEVEAKISELKAAGRDTTQLEAWLADFNQKIAVTKQKYEAAKVEFRAIKGEPGFDPVMEITEADRLFKKGRQFINEADQYVKEARAQLIKIVKEMKQSGMPAAEPAQTTETAQ